MLNTDCIKIKTENGEREILISPFLLQSKELPDLKSGKLSKLYFYDPPPNNEHEVKPEERTSPDEFKSNKYIINEGQDFEKYYLGSFCIDFATKSCSKWDGKPGSLSEREVKALGESLFNPQSERRKVVMFTPTRPSDFNFGIT